MTAAASRRVIVIAALACGVGAVLPDGPVAGTVTPAASLVLFREGLQT
jgi:hypothetical protein